MPLAGRISSRRTAVVVTQRLNYGRDDPVLSLGREAAFQIALLVEYFENRCGNLTRSVYGGDMVVTTGAEQAAFINGLGNSASDLCCSIHLCLNPSSPAAGCQTAGFFNSGYK